MSEILSQEQIDQLLSAGSFGGGGDATSSGGDTPVAADKHKSLEKTFSLFCAQASSVLSTVVSRKVTVRLESCGSADTAALAEKTGADPICVVMPLKDGFSGDLYLYISKSDVAILSDLMVMGDGSAPYSEEHNDALKEFTSQIMGSFTLALTSEIGTQVAFDPVQMTAYNLDALPLPADQLDMMIAQLSVEGKPDSWIVVLLGRELGARIAEKNPSEDAAGAALGSEFGNMAGGAFDTGGSNGDFGSVFQDGLRGGHSKPMRKESIEMLLDVELDVSIELGRSNLSIKRILELAPGSVVELDRMAGEPVDLLVNNKVVAKGEVVVIDESFGIRILSLVSPEERIKSLQ